VVLREKEERLSSVREIQQGQGMQVQLVERTGSRYKEPGKESNLSKPIAGEPSSLSESAHQKIVRSSFNGIEFNHRGFPGSSVIEEG
jgi:transposase